MEWRKYTGHTFRIDCYYVKSMLIAVPSNLSARCRPRPVGNVPKPIRSSAFSPLRICRKRLDNKPAFLYHLWELWIYANSESLKLLLSSGMPVASPFTWSSLLRKKPSTHIVRYSSTQRASPPAPSFYSDALSSVPQSVRGTGNLRSCFKITGEFQSASEKVAVKAGIPGYERRASAASIS